MNIARVFASLPAGLTTLEVSRRLGLEYSKCRRLIAEHKYRASDGRTYSQANRRKLDPENVDWTLSNADIARECGVSRERVRVVRKKYLLPFVESRGRKRRNAKAESKLKWVGHVKSGPYSY